MISARRYMLTCCLCLSSLCACQHGVAPLWSQAKPETVIEVDPVSRRVYVHSSDGRAVQAKGLVFRHDGTEFTVDDLSITERSVELRTANVQQIEAAAQVTRAVADILAHFTPMIQAAQGRAAASRPGT